jgi:hypothetical protein
MRKKLEFEDMDWSSQYHAILRRPAFLRFMVVPHYTYLVLKMPRPNGIIIVKGNFGLFDIGDKEFHKMVQAFGVTAEYEGPTEKKDHKILSATSQPTHEKTIDSTPETKKIWVHIEDPNNSTPNEPGTPTA